MTVATALIRYAHALGRYKAAWRHARVDLRQAAQIAIVFEAWDIFRRDAWAGETGPEHGGEAILTHTADPRRDGFLLWLADNGQPATADAANLIVHMLGAIRRFDTQALALLQAARRAGENEPRSPTACLLATYASDDDLLAPLCTLASTVDQLRGHPAFLEVMEREARHIASHSFSHHVPPNPGAAWALNLMMLAQSGLPASMPWPPGLVSRALFHPDLEPEDIGLILIDNATAALTRAYSIMERLEGELTRGEEALRHLSRNSRAREAWLILAATRRVTRTQLARGLNLSRAGADIQAHALANAGLATLSRGGHISWRAAIPMDQAASRLGNEIASLAIELDAATAEIDRLLARQSD